MLQLVNISNYCSDTEMIGNCAEGLETFLAGHNLDGVEMMFCAPWDSAVYRREWIHGVHLRFWPNWLDFWRGDKEELLRQFGSEDTVRAVFGGLRQEDWLSLYRDNFRQAVDAGAKYAVFHVCHARTEELYHGRFTATDLDVVSAVVEVVNSLADVIPPQMELLFENLWWPGLTLLDLKITRFLLERVAHRKVGIMLDTGHLMNTNTDLVTEEEGVEYILDILRRMGLYRRYIKGIHLHRSLSGTYVKASREKWHSGLSSADIMSHVLRIDEHLPFRTPAVGKIIDMVQPYYIVHEFINKNRNNWSDKIRIQQQAMRGGMAR